MSEDITYKILKNFIDSCSEEDRERLRQLLSSDEIRNRLTSARR